MSDSGTPMDSETAASLVTNAHLVTDIFGRWPSFHDSEVLYLAIDRDERWLEIHVWVFETIPDPSDSKRFVSTNEHCVAFRFKSIANVETDGFNGQNVLWDLCFERRNEQLHVNGESIYGLGFELDCSEIVVVNIEPYERVSRKRTRDGW